jgi:serine/threonine-protein kinase HipA
VRIRTPVDLGLVIRERRTKLGLAQHALAFNWIVAGSDAHAKNYSLLLGGAGRVRLAPLYDIASALPYGKLDLQRLALAMKIGGKYRVHRIGRNEWRKLSAEVHPLTSSDATLERFASMIACTIVAASVNVPN